MTTKFEDLPIKDFIKQLKSLGDYTISAQADGLTFYFGLDNDNNFYTSPYASNKRTKFFYKTSDYPLKVENNSFRGAHAALIKIEEKISKYLTEGQAIECQLIANAETEFGGTYNKIILVKPCLGEQSIPKESVLNEIHDNLSEKIQVKVKQVTSVNGEDLDKDSVIAFWKLTKTKSAKGNLLTTTKLHSILEKLEKYLAEPNDKAKSLGLELTNLDVAAINLTKVQMDLRDDIKVEREKINALILKKYKFPIKSEIIDKLEKEFGTQAGVLHKGSNSVYLASTDFISNARFDTTMKRELDGYIRTFDKNASLEDRGGLIGIDEQRIATLLGVPELAKFQSAKNVFKNLRGENPRATAENMAEQLSQLDFYGVKQKINAIFKTSKQEAQKKLNEFKQNSNDFVHVGAEGDKDTYSPSEIKDNLAYFAQAIKGYDTKITELKRCKSFADLILMLYEPIIFSLHGKHITESLLIEHNPSEEIVSKMTAEEICQAYTATILASQLLLRAKSPAIKKIIKDPSHASLKKLTPHISPLNFWGMMAFSPFIPVMKDKLSSKVNTLLKKMGGRVTYQRIIKLHHTLSNGSFVQDWDLQEQNAELITTRLETNGQSINMVIAGIRNWDDIKISDKNTIVAKVFFYLQQHCPGSLLLQPIRRLSNELLIMANKENNLKKEPLEDVVENLFLTLSEQEMSLSASNISYANNNDISMWSDIGTQLDGGSTGSSTATKGNNNNSTQMVKFMNGKPIIKRKRDFEKKKKFERLREEEGGGADATPVIDTGKDGVTTTSAIATYPKRLFGKKKTIKRVIPGFTKKIPTNLDKFFQDLEESVKEIKLSWSDVDFNGNLETDWGINHLKEKYNLEFFIEGTGTDGWPIMKVVGYKHRLAKFLKDDYCINAEKIKELLGE